jgi:hypothetical protein
MGMGLVVGEVEAEERRRRFDDDCIQKAERHRSRVTRLIPPRSRS